ncbi:hypothetical protein JCM19301_2425 [Jejuia pallidilutea]|uniref:Uncharacterized protein n=1 Tax=Jejuia pallidilutea TaxID=504487 RepID=A0A090VNI7_9FLAO|nr:hypothetical protein JCM19301_2425 [Jejuia pallidilutea]GAL69575.1 hypothetical protein JCM19302_3764 [Jejuia pallidilutea]GAL87958.1 hypothetical protein JCM19538_2321 [Jejuia pallidilutea]
MGLVNKLKNKLHLKILKKIPTHKQLIHFYNAIKANTEKLKVLLLIKAQKTIID